MAEKEYIERVEVVRELTSANAQAEFRQMTGSEAYARILAIVNCAPAADVAPVVHGRWIEEHGQTLIPVEYDDSGNLVLHDYTTYRCNLCGRTESKKEPYCNCGARMGGE